MNPDPKFVVKRMSQKAQLYKQGRTGKGIFHMHKHHQCIRRNESHELWQSSRSKLNEMIEIWSEKFKEAEMCITKATISDEYAAFMTKFTRTNYVYQLTML